MRGGVGFAMHFPVRPGKTGLLPGKMKSAAYLVFLTEAVRK